MTKIKAIRYPDGASVINEVLNFAGPRPREEGAVGAKNKYAVGFADKMAELIARRFVTS